MRFFLCASISSNAFFLVEPEASLDEFEPEERESEGTVIHHHDSVANTLTSSTLRTMRATPTQINHMRNLPPDNSSTIAAPTPG